MSDSESEALSIELERARLSAQDKGAIAQELARNSVTDAAQIHLTLDRATTKFAFSRWQAGRARVGGSKNDLRAAAGMVFALVTNGKSSSVNEFLKTLEANPKFSNVIFSRDALVDGIRRWEDFRYVLETIASPKLVSVDGGKQSERKLVSDIDRGRKERERFYLWEPIFGLWETGHRAVGFSENGPIMRILNLVHAGLQLDPPKPDSVRTAFGSGRRCVPATTCPWCDHSLNNQYKTITMRRSGGDYRVAC